MAELVTDLVERRLRVSGVNGKVCEWMSLYGGSGAQGICELRPGVPIWQSRSQEWRREGKRWWCE